MQLSITLDFPLCPCINSKTKKKETVDRLIGVEAQALLLPIPY
jgi:hypothetical protein